MVITSFYAPFGRSLAEKNHLDRWFFSYFIENTAKLRGMGNVLSRADLPRSVAPEGLNGVEIGRLNRREKAEHNADAHGKHHGDEDRRDADGRRRAHDG